MAECQSQFTLAIDFRRSRVFGLGLSICEWLEFEIGRERHEQIVVATFLNAVREFRFKGDNNSTRSLPVVKGAMSVVKVEKPETEIGVGNPVGHGWCRTTNSPCGCQLP